MSQDIITLSAADLIQFEPGFSSRFGPKQKVGVVFCQDKSDPAWRHSDDDAAGFVETAKYTEGSSGSGLVYVLAGGTRRPHQTSKNRIQGATDLKDSKHAGNSTNDPRTQVVFLLVHELVHVLQMWIHYPEYWRVYQKYRSYETNAFEKMAYRKATEFVNRNSGKILNGHMDKYLPFWLKTKK